MSLCWILGFINVLKKVSDEMKYNHVDEENSVAVGNVGTAYLYATLKDSIGNCNIKKQRKIPIRVSAEGNV